MSVFQVTISKTTRRSAIVLIDQVVEADVEAYDVLKYFQALYRGLEVKVAGIQPVKMEIERAKSEGYSLPPPKEVKWVKKFPSFRLPLNSSEMDLAKEIGDLRSALRSKVAVLRALILGRLETLSFVDSNRIHQATIKTDEVGGGSDYVYIEDLELRYNVVEELVGATLE